MAEFKVGDRVKQRKSTQGAGEWKKGVVTALRDDEEFDIGVLPDGATVESIGDGYEVVDVWWMNRKEIKHA